MHCITNSMKIILDFFVLLFSFFPCNIKTFIFTMSFILSLSFRLSHFYYNKKMLIARSTNQFQDWIFTKCCMYVRIRVTRENAYRRTIAKIYSEKLESAFASVRNESFQKFVYYIIYRFNFVQSILSVDLRFRTPHNAPQTRNYAFTTRVNPKSGLPFEIVKEYYTDR